MSGTLLAGAHVCVFGNDLTGVEGRLAGLELRDTLLVLSGLVSQRVFLFRKPLCEGTIHDQILATDTGAILIERLGSGKDKGIWPITTRTDDRTSMAGPMRAAETDTTQGRWPTNVVLVHRVECEPGEIDEQNGLVKWECHTSCASPKLPQSAASFYPQFRSLSDFLAWLRRLVEPPVG